MESKVIYTISLLIFLALQPDTGLAKEKTEINIATIVSEMMEQVQARRRTAGQIIKAMDHGLEE
jgi:tetrahydromethanopterin S-methyltransferase subunit B